MSCLIFACYHATEDVIIPAIKLLLKHQADPNYILELDEKYTTLLTICDEQTHLLELLLLLQKYGLNQTEFEKYKSIISIDIYNTITNKYICKIVKDSPAKSSKPPECIICLKNTPVFFAKPCHHMLFCYQCYLTIPKEQHKMCCICKTNVKRYQRLFF